MDNAAPLQAQDEVAELLVGPHPHRHDQHRGHATSAGERAAAEWVAGKLADVGIDSVIHESERGRASLVARIAGADR